MFRASATFASIAIALTMGATGATAQPPSQSHPMEVAVTMPGGVRITIATWAVLSDGVRQSETREVVGETIGGGVVAFGGPEQPKIVHKFVQVGRRCYGYDLAIEPLDDGGLLKRFLFGVPAKMRLEPYSVAKPEACAEIVPPAGSLDARTVAAGEAVTLEIFADERSGAQIVDDIRVTPR